MSHSFLVLRYSNYGDQGWGLGNSCLDYQKKAILTQIAVFWKTKLSQIIIIAGSEYCLEEVEGINLTEDLGKERYYRQESQEVEGN